VRDSRRQPSDARELLGAHELVLDILERARHLVDSLAQPLQLGGVGRRNPRFEVALGNGIRGPGQGGHRLEHKAMDEMAAEDIEDENVPGDETEERGQCQTRGNGLDEQRRCHGERECCDRQEAEVPEQLARQGGTPHHRVISRHGGRPVSRSFFEACGQVAEVCELVTPHQKRGLPLTPGGSATLAQAPAPTARSAADRPGTPAEGAGDGAVEY
jgi:hypothetical protein